MKKTYILIAVLFSSLAFCTKNNTTQISSKNDYTDSITIDLFSYDYYYGKISPYVNGVTLSAKGQTLLKPSDSLLKSYADSSNQNYLYGVIAPKYEPREFEAWVYDSIPLVESDTSDTNLLVTVYSESRNSFYCPDTSAINLDKNIQPISIDYYYGYGFVLGDQGSLPWGIGKIKIYYK